MLDASGHVVLVSFSGAMRLERRKATSLAAVSSSRTATRTEARIVPHAAAPERARASPPSPAADVWALGCLIYEMLMA